MSEKLSFDEIYDRHSGPVYRYCIWQVRNLTLAEDIAAQTFLAAFRSYGKRDFAADEIRPWLLKIARNLIIDHYRKEKRRQRFLTFLGRSREAVGDIEQTAETNAELERIRSVLQQMKERDRTLIALRISGGLSVREVATMLGMSEANANMATQRAFQRFRKLVGNLGGDEL